MANVNVTIRMDSDLKKQAEELFSELGMSLTTAITIFMKQAVREKRIPFEISLNIPSLETLETLKEFDSFDDLLKEVTENT